MPRDGSGVYTKPANTTAITGTVIDPGDYNTLQDDFASEVTASVPRSGTAAMTGNLNMGSNRITSLAAATSGLNAPQAQQAASNSMIAAAAAGVADAYTVTLTPPAISYATFMPVWFTTTFTNTGASTINVSSLGVKNIKRDSGLALRAGDISTTKPNLVIYDGTQFILIATDNTIKLTPYTVAGAPSVGPAGSVIYVSNGDAGSPCLAVSNGTNWLRVALGAAISAT